MVYHPNFPPNLSIAPSIDHVATKALGHAFGIEAQRDAISRYGIAGRVWEVAYALSAYVDPADVCDIDPPFVDDPRKPLGVVELGSGTGMVAASVVRAIQRSATSAGFVVATDLPDVCPLLQRNLGLHTLTEGDPNVVFVRPLTWGNFDHATAIISEFGSHPLTHIICSDLASVYFPELLGPLLRTLIHLTSLPRAPSGLAIKIVISYKIRSLLKETPFWSAFGLWFSFRPILARRHVRAEIKDTPLEHDSDTPGSRRQFGVQEGTDRTFVFVAHRRPESVAWHVPETDEELMEGVGARNTATKKGDDTFETILLMGMDTTGE